MKFIATLLTIMVSSVVVIFMFKTDMIHALIFSSIIGVLVNVVEVD